MASNNYIYKMKNAGGMSTVTRYTDMLAGNTVWNPWEPQGAFDSLATVTVGTAVSSISFSGIPATDYKHLQIRGLTRSTNASNWSDMNMQFNSDTAASYSYHYMGGDGASTFAAAGASATSMFCTEVPAGNTAASIFGTIIDILDYSSTTKFKTLRSLNGSDKNGTGYLYFHSGNWRNQTSAVNQIVLTLSTGSFPTNSTFSLYGVK